MQEKTYVRAASLFARWSVAGLLAVLVVSLGSPPLVHAASGDLDPTFGSGGVVTTPIGFLAVASALALQADGKLVAAGDADVSGSVVFALARYNSNGSLDATFGSGGVVTTPIGSSALAFALARQADGKLVAAGTAGGVFALARYIGQTGVAFSAFTVKLELTVGPSASLDRFQLNGAFTLGTSSHGIAPLTEPVTLALAGGTGSVAITIPAGSFTKTGNGGFAFEGTLNGVALEAQMTPLGSNQFTFKAEGTGADLTGFANPVTVTLTIGDDSGTTTATAEIQ